MARKATGLIASVLLLAGCSSHDNTPIYPEQTDNSLTQMAPSAAELDKKTLPTDTVVGRVLVYDFDQGKPVVKRERTFKNFADCFGFADTETNLDQNVECTRPRDGVVQALTAESFVAG